MKGDSPQNERPFRASFARVNITPEASRETGPLLQGIAAGSRRAHEVDTPLTMHVLMLEDFSRTRILMVSADIFAVDKALYEAVCRAAEPWGIPAEGILLSASHTHYAPGSLSGCCQALGPCYEDFVDGLARTVERSLSLLHDTLGPCELSRTTARVRIGFNRRLPTCNRIDFAPNAEGAYDEHTPVLRISSPSTGRTLVVVNHGCHPTAMGSAAVLSADFPGHMREALLRRPDIDAVMFLQGAAGDVKPGEWTGGNPSFSNSAWSARRLGKRLGEAVLTAIDQGLYPIEGRFACHLEPIDLPTEEGIERTSLQTLSIGNELQIVSAPVEPMASTALALRAETSEPDAVMVAGYTNGLLGYVPTDEQMEQGGYEVELAPAVYQRARFSRGAEAALLDGWRKGLDRTRLEARCAEGGITDPACREKRAFFVMSSGRCGTLSLAKLLEQASNAMVWHHPQPYLIRETLSAYHGHIDCAETFWNARGAIIRRALQQGKAHGETDHNMTPFCPWIAKDIPDAKFLILVRHPADFVRSGMRRNYYRGHPWDAGRLVPEPGTEEARMWPSMTQFEQVCWLWAETYRRIELYADSIGRDRVLTVRFEDLVDGTDTAQKVFEFLGLEGFRSELATQILSERHNAQRQGSFPLPQDWTDEQWATMGRVCGELAEYYGYPLGRRGAVPVTQRSELSVAGAPCRLLFLEMRGTSTGGHLDHIVTEVGRTYAVRHVVTDSEKEVEQQLKWCDVLWLEWANEMAVYVTRQHRRAVHDKPVLCRLHGYEVFTEFPAKTDWSVIDKLIFVADHKRSLFRQRFPGADVDSLIVRNGVDTARFRLPPSKENTKNLLLLGHLNYRKGLPMLLQFYNELRKRDPEFHLFIRGDWQDARYEMAVRTMVRELALESSISFCEEWIEDLDAWLHDKSHILSFSLEESFHYAIGNGMAAGLKPVIHAWNESRNIWPEEYIFSDLESFLTMAMDETFDPPAYRAKLFELGLDAGRQVSEVKTAISEVTGSYSRQTVPVS